MDANMYEMPVASVEDGYAVTGPGHAVYAGTHDSSSVYAQAADGGYSTTQPGHQVYATAGDGE